MKGQRFQGWAQISEYLRMNVRNAQRKERNSALPVRRHPGGLRAPVFAYKAELDEWLDRARVGSEIQEDLIPTPVGHVERRHLFSYRGGDAAAFRLWGAGTAYVSCDCLFVKYVDQPYTIPQELQSRASERVSRLDGEARRLNKVFFNGPCVRLIQWHHNQAGPAEEDTLSLVLAPVGWHDYEGTNGLIHEENKQEEAYEKYVDMRTIHSGNMERGCRLSNIIGNAVTIFTCDGKVGYQVRGQRQSTIPGLLTSSVDENINRYKDDVDKKDSHRRLNVTGSTESTKKRGNDYHPKGLPHPFAAVLRGIADEVSPRLMEYVGPFAIKVTGLTFGLDLLHPELLWIVCVNLTAEKFTKLRYECSGTETDEGRIKFVPASFSNKLTQAILDRPDWHPAGKASFIRAIELVENYKPNARATAVFDILAEAR